MFYTVRRKKGNLLFPYLPKDNLLEGYSKIPSSVKEILGLQSFSPWGEIKVDNIWHFTVLDNPILYIKELVFELARIRLFPNKPSRWNSVFVVGSLDDAVKFLKIYRQNMPAEIWEVSPEGSSQPFKADMMFLEINYGKRNPWENAIQYWKGEVGENPFWEYLIPYPVRLIRPVPLRGKSEKNNCIHKL